MPYRFMMAMAVCDRLLTTGKLPGVIVAADLNHDGWDDLIVRNAGDGTYRSPTTQPI